MTTVGSRTMYFIPRAKHLADDAVDNVLQALPTKNERLLLLETEQTGVDRVEGRK